jgi:hypothetical protein
MKKLTWLLLSAVVLLVGCSKDEPAPLPPLKKMEMPESIVGLYSGRLPCDNCKANMVKVELKEDSSAVVVQSIAQGTTLDSIQTDTLQGTYSLLEDKLTMVLSNGQIRWVFQKGSYNSFTLLTGAGTVYTDQEGFKAELIRIYSAPKKALDSTAAVQDSGSR